MRRSQHSAFLTCRRIEPFANRARALAVITLVGWVVPPPSATAGSSVAIRIVHEHWIVVPVRIGGEGPFEFLLDSGTNVTILTPELAQRVAVTPAARVTLATAAGTRVVPYARLVEMSVGSKSVSEIDVVLYTLPDVPAALSRDVFAGTASWDGLLPTSLFEWIYFNNRDAYVMVNAAPSRGGPPARLQRR